MDNYMTLPICDILDHKDCPECSSSEEHLEHTMYDVQRSFEQAEELAQQKSRLIAGWEEASAKLCERFPDAASGIMAFAAPYLQWLRDNNMREVSLAEQQRDEIIIEIRRMEEQSMEKKGKQ